MGRYECCEILCQAKKKLYLPNTKAVLFSIVYYFVVYTSKQQINHGGLTKCRCNYYMLVCMIDNELVCITLLASCVPKQFNKRLLKLNLPQSNKSSNLLRVLAAYLHCERGLLKQNRCTSVYQEVIFRIGKPNLAAF